MTISSKKLNDIKLDFFTGPDNQFLSIPADDPFWGWFLENSEQYSVCEDFSDLFTDECYLSGNCYGNSLMITFQEGVDYCEGFVKVQGAYILHGFNIFMGGVIDSTIQSNKLPFLDHNGNLPTEYYGVLIPRDYLPKKPEITSLNFYLNNKPKIQEFYEYSELL